MASSSAPLGLELLVPAGVAQLGIVRARSEYGLTDADLQGLPRSAHPGAGVVFSVKDLARVAILKGYRGRGQRVVRISRPDVSRAETLFLPVGIDHGRRGKSHDAGTRRPPRAPARALAPA